jgi:hypothetical protein
MNKELKEVMGTSTFKVVGNYIYAKVKTVPDLNDCFLISKDEDEITAVFEESRVSKINMVEKNKDVWKLIEIKVSKPFLAVGFLAAISNTIANNDMNVLIVSTYSKDYILVRLNSIKKAKESLLQLGLKEE